MEGTCGAVPSALLAQAARSRRPLQRLICGAILGHVWFPRAVFVLSMNQNQTLGAGFSSGLAFLESSPSNIRNL